MSKKLLFSVRKEDFTIQTFCSGGPGGQHQNKTESGVRIIHKDSGAVGESRNDRSQHTNKKLAFKRLVATPKFQLWLKKKTGEVLSKKTPEEIVEEMMHPRNLKIEGRNEDGKWEEVS